MSPDKLTTLVKQQAAELGFPLQGVCPAVAVARPDLLDKWLAAGFAGQMHYFAERREAYDHPQHVLDGVRSIVMLGMHYSNAAPREPVSGEGRVSRYAWGEVDYHHLIRERLHQLADYLRQLVPKATTRGVVDTAPLLEREFAQLAGLGWIGKNTLLLSRTRGSYFFLAALLTDQELDYDQPQQTDHCGTCTACLEACPTDAFPEPYVLDATRCISYLTIELQDTIPRELRPGMGEWVFGCDVCQDVCPWNRKAPETGEAAFLPIDAMNPLELAELFEMGEAEFRRRFRHTPLWRSHRRGLLRNGAIVLGNQRCREALPALKMGLVDEEPLVRQACAWALGQIATPAAVDLLTQRYREETEPSVLQEIDAALDRG